MVYNGDDLRVIHSYGTDDSQDPVAFLPDAIGRRDNAQVPHLFNIALRSHDYVYAFFFETAVKEMEQIGV